MTGKIAFASKSTIYEKLDVNLVSNEDIFLFKSMTLREGDVLDCDRIMKQGIDYDIVYNEIVGLFIDGIDISSKNMIGAIIMSGFFYC